MMHNWYGHGAGWEGWLMFLFMVVFVVAIIVAIVYFARYLGQPQATTVQAPPQQAVMAAPTAPTAPAESPQDIVKRRYAAGEIEREEYLQKLGDL
jgi:uncharacterized membrane protein